MSAERADNYRVLQDIKRKDLKAACYIQEIINRILETARKDGEPIKSAIVITNEDMTQEEEEMALFWGFLREGYSPEKADQKVKEWMKAEKELDRKFQEIDQIRDNEFWIENSKQVNKEN